MFKETTIQLNSDVMAEVSNTDYGLKIAICKTNGTVIISRVLTYSAFNIQVAKKALASRGFKHIYLMLLKVTDHYVTDEKHKSFKLYDSFMLEHKGLENFIFLAEHTLYDNVLSSDSLGFIPNRIDVDEQTYVKLVHLSEGLEITIYKNSTFIGGGVLPYDQENINFVKRTKNGGFLKRLLFRKIQVETDKWENLNKKHKKECFSAIKAFLLKHNGLDIFINLAEMALVKNLPAISS